MILGENMIDKLKADACHAYHQLLDIGLGKYSRGIISVVSREADILVTKTAETTLISKLSDEMQGFQNHIALFRAFPDICTVVQPYAKVATVFAQIGMDIPILGTFHEDYFHADIPCISSIDEVRNTFRERSIDPLQTPAVLLLHHGAFTWGRNSTEAVNNANYLEETASLAYLSMQLDPGIMPFK